MESALRKMPRPVAFARWPIGTASVLVIGTDDEAALWHAIKAGCAEAEAAAIRDNISLVDQVAGNYHRKNKDSSLTLEDLIHEGCIGLLQAIRSFDPSLNTPLRSIARITIRRVIQSALADDGLLIRVPRNNIFRSKTNELADHIRARVAAARDISSLDALLPNESSLDAPLPNSRLSLVDVLSSASPTPEELLSAKREHDVGRMLRGLSDKQRDAVQRVVIDEETYEMAGLALGVTKQNMQLHVMRGLVHVANNVKRLNIAPKRSA